MKKNALITGGAGFIASHLAESLYNKYKKIYLVDNLVRTHNLRNIQSLLLDHPKKYIFRKLDISNYYDLIDLFLYEKIKDVYHLAATRINRCTKYPLEGHSFNATAGMNIIKFCQEFNCHLFLASSASVYNKPKRLPIKETDFIQPRTLYGAAKYYLEGLCRGMLQPNQYKIGRFFSVYGPRMDNEGAYTELIVNWFTQIKNGNNKLVVYGDPKEKLLDLIYVSDVVNAINIMMNKINKQQDVYNVSAEYGISLYQLKLIMEKITHTSLEFDHRKENRTDIEKARYGNTDYLKSLGWDNKISLEEGLKNTWNWLKEI